MTTQPMKRLKQEILSLLANRTYGLSIEEIADLLHVNRATAAKYLFALETSNAIAARSIGKANYIP
ncbi:MAG: HTH domain-containing protein [Candidatus Aenigmarchaeota archaeon]|nr:HTH domain-containing protein [Candidatus Aenigmarchaeota archaeon]